MLGDNSGLENRMRAVKEVHDQTEADPESRIAAALTVSLPGMSPASICHQHRFRIRLGHKVVEIDGRATDQAIGRLDVVLTRDGKPLAVLEIKRPSLELTDGDCAQGLSYARLLEPMAPLMVITNGATTQLYRTIDGSKWNPCARHLHEREIHFAEHRASVGLCGLRTSIRPHDQQVRKLIFPRFGGLLTVSVRGVRYGQVQDLEEIYA
jgi:hypothetical protein